MKKILILTFGLLASLLAAQSPVAITATITGANTAPYAYGNYTIRLVDGSGNVLSNPSIHGNSFQSQFSGALTSAGALSVTLYKNSDIDQPGTQWKFQICSQPPSSTLPLTVSASVCFSQSATVTGAGSLSTTLSASAPAIYYYNPVTGVLYASNVSGGGTTTNPLTMDNSGSGAASGTAFDGSVARTLSWNTLGAQQALTLTTTGTSGPATLSAGALNIPQYASGGGLGGLCSATISNTASDIGVQINTAVSSLGAAGGKICVAPGTYTMSTTATINQKSISLVGPSDGSAIINCSVAGSCLIVAPPLFTSGLVYGAEVRNLTIIGSNAAGNIPFQTKDMIGWKIENVFLDGGSTSTTPCYSQESVSAWSEWNDISMRFGLNCSSDLRMKNAVGNSFHPGSFAYNTYKLWGQSKNLGISCETDVDLYNSKILFFDDMYGGSAFNAQDSCTAPRDGTTSEPNSTLEIHAEKISGTPVFFANTSNQPIIFDGLYTSLRTDVAQGTAFSDNFRVTGVTNSNYQQAASFNHIYAPILTDNSGASASYGVAGLATCSGLSAGDCHFGVGPAATSSQPTTGTPTMGWNKGTGHGFLGIFGTGRNLEWFGSDVYLPNLTSQATIGTDINGKIVAGTSLSNPMTTLGDTMYGGAAGAVTRLAGPTTSSHTFVLSDVPSGGLATAPAWLDLATYLASPAAIGGTAPAAGTFSALTDSALTAGNCVQATTGGLLTTTSGACGTSSGTVTTTGTPASGDIAAFSGATSITTATATQVNTLLKNLTGCNTVGNVYTPQSGTCVAPSSSSGAYTNITGSGQITATGCTQSASTGGHCDVSGTTTTAVTLSVIPGTYNSIQYKVWGQGSSALAGVNVTFNSDTGSNYVFNTSFQTNNAAPAPSTGANQTSCNAGNFTTGLVSQLIGEMPFYADTTFDKAITTRGTVMGSLGTLSSNIDQTGSCAWNNTAAVTSITFTLSAGHFVSGTKFMLLGQN